MKEDLEKLPWRHLTREEWLNCEVRHAPKVILVFEKDLDNFIENLIQDICIEANMPYSKVNDVFVNKNVVFFALKNNLFTVNTGNCQVWNTLIMDVLRQLLEIPDFSQMNRRKRTIFRKRERRLLRKNKRKR